MNEAGAVLAGPRFLVLPLALALSSALAQPAPQAVPPPPRSAGVAARPVPPRSEEGVRWQGLTPAQRDVLAPLEKDWPAIDAQRKQKWLVIADRFGSLPPAERGRISERMTEWSRMTPAERGELRLRYQESKQIPAPDRSARWEAYQALPPEQKQQLAERAAPPREPAPAPRPREAGGAKVNVVPNPALVQPPRPVAPTVVQATPGATTRLMTRPVAPPAHQQSGLPKIAATPEFVNRSTLLPRRGPQAAAVTPPPAAAPATRSREAKSSP